MAMEGRILFEGNPWPQGHRLVSCDLVGMVEPMRGAYLDNARYVGPALSLAIELRSADYCEGDDPDQRDLEGADDWSSKIGWNNYGAAWIGASASSSTPGFMVSDGRVPFDPMQPEYRFMVDSLPLEVADFSDFFAAQAFGCYILGHDAVADHDIRLHGRTADGSYLLDWTGKVARAYVGDTSFEHSFRVHASGVRLKEISLWYLDAGRAKEHLDIDLDPAIKPADYLAPFVTDVGAFDFETRVDGIGRSAVYAVPKGR